MMIAFKGKKHMIQYMPNKLNKWGLKAWCLAESKTGYAWNWQLYSGKANGVQENGLAYRVVMDLTEPLFNQGYHLYVDNFYTSPTLFRDLAVHGIGACGTLRKNRLTVPDNIRNATMKAGDPIITAEEGHMKLIGWFDKRPVFMVSTIHNFATFEKDVRTRGTGGETRKVV